MIKKIIFFLLSFFLYYIFPKYAFADSNFTTSFDITYTTLASGTTHAVFNGTLENLNNTIYAPSYSIKLGFTDIKNPTAFDTYGKIDPSIQTKANGDIVTLVFNTTNIGEGRITRFSFAFDTNQLASHVGSIWEINIPGIANQADFKNFTVHLQVPDSFGKPSIIKPQTVGTSLDFDKNTLGSSGISLAFGNSQKYNFNLTYHVKNTNFFPVKTEIALPPSTNYQDVYITDISPKPTNVVKDADGNWLAQFMLLPSQRLTVTAKGFIVVGIVPKSEELTPEQRKLYTQPQQYWQSNASDIQKLANDLKTPNAIYDYVSNQLTYDFTRVAGDQKRLGAEAVLKNSTSAVCLEFTDLFIAIARAAGIPAREIDGYAYTQNPSERPLLLTKDILHTWPEYYSDTQKKWIMIDPTWANTTHGTDYFHALDFDHVAFVIKGKSSTYPVPAGGYKFDANTNTKDVFVSFDDSFSPSSAQIEVNFDMKSAILSGFPIEGMLTVKNAGNALVPGQNFTVSSDHLFPKTQEFTTGDIPPFGFVQVPIHFNQTSFLTNTRALITIQVAGQTLTKTVSIQSVLFQTKYIIGGLICAGILGIIIFIITSKSRRIHLQK